MEGARVLVIEDGETVRRLVRQVLQLHGHAVAEEAATLPEALDSVTRLGKGEFEADVVLLDGNLGSEHGGGHDARRISRHLQVCGVTAKVIGFSVDEMRLYGVPVDFDSQKDMHRVIDAIAEL